MKLYNTDKIESMNNVLNEMFNPPTAGGAGASEGLQTFAGEPVADEPVADEPVAAAEATEILTKNKEKAQRLKAQAEAEYKVCEFGASVRIFDKALELDPTNLEIRAGRDAAARIENLLKFFMENQKHYEEKFLNPKSRNYWNLYLLFFCKKSSFHVPSVKALHYDPNITRDQDILEENKSLKSFVDSIGKKDKMGQMKHNTKDLKNAIEDYFMKKQRDIQNPSELTELTPQQRNEEFQDLEKTLEKRDTVAQTDGYADYRANVRRIRKTASKKLKSGFKKAKEGLSSLKKSLSERFGRNKGGGRRRRKTYRKNKIHYKKRKSKKKKKKHTRKTRRP